MIFFHFHVYTKFRENESAQTELRQMAFTKKKASRVLSEGGGSNFYDRKKPSLLSVYLGCSVAQS
jgi:hypothetical protein